MKYSHFKQREYQRQNNFSISNALKNILAEDGEPIPDDEFEYTLVPYRLSRPITKLPSLDAYSYCESQCTIEDRWWEAIDFTDFSLSEEEAVIDENDPVLSLEGTVMYIGTEMSTCFFDEQSQFASKQLRRILRSRRIFNLGEIPESDDHFTMDVICDDLTGEAALTLLIRRCAWGSAEMYKENIQTISDRMNVLLERLYRSKMLRKDESTYDEGLSLALNLEEIDELIDRENELLDNVELMIASIFIGNLRIIHKKAQNYWNCWKVKYLQ